MSFLGKVYAHEKDENYEGFVKSLNLQEDKHKFLASFKPSFKLEKNGDEYTFFVIHSVIDKKLVFKSGVPFDEEIVENVTAKDTITVNGNMLTQIQDFGKNHIVTYKMEFSDTQLVQTITTNDWNGSARRYFKS